MASSNNLASSIEPWSFRPCSFPESWISEAFTRETDALTRALQQSLYSNNTDSVIYNDASSFQQLIKPEAAPSSDRRRNSLGNGKITKRKSRASKRSPTMYIAADPANFRRMVQEVTGIQFTGEVESEMRRMPPVFKPEPHRPRNPIQACILPTLDTSESWLGRTTTPPLDDASSAKDNQTFRSFPTLESWH